MQIDHRCFTLGLLIFQLSLFEDSSGAHQKESLALLKSVAAKNLVITEPNNGTFINLYSTKNGSLIAGSVKNVSREIDREKIMINTTIAPYSKISSSFASNPTVACSKEEVIQVLQTNISCYPPSAAMQCFHDPFFCKKYFTSGKRELKDERPKYGEYSYLNHLLWFRVIQHGGIAFLFHPCTNKGEVEKLRQVASQCLHRYVLAPYDKLSRSAPIALVSWGCFYLSSHVNGSKMKWWIREHAYNGPASHVHTNGKFQENLVKQSEVITDEKDAILCPNEEEINRYSVVPTTLPPKMISEKKKHNPESIINNRMIKLHSKIRPGIEVKANITVTKVETGSAVWAAASLIFLCGILLGWLLYTKQWVKSNDGGYRYNPLRNSEDTFECEPGQSEFNLLKSSQKIMSAFQWKDKQERKTDPLSKVNLMVPINEEDEDVEYDR